MLYLADEGLNFTTCRVSEGGLGLSKLNNVLWSISYSSFKTKITVLVVARYETVTANKIVETLKFWLGFSVLHHLGMFKDIWAKTFPDPPKLNHFWSLGSLKHGDFDSIHLWIVSVDQWYLKISICGNILHVDPIYHLMLN